ncbi:hypothetical protein ACFQU7_23610 [Pseudoroseomonas wenyumeiae]
MSQDTLTDYSAWVGRQEEQRDVVAAGPLDRLAATLDRDDPAAQPGDAAPPLSHWIMFLPGPGIPPSAWTATPCVADSCRRCTTCRAACGPAGGCPSMRRCASAWR